MEVTREREETLIYYLSMVSAHGSICLLSSRKTLETLTSDVRSEKSSSSWIFWLHVDHFNRFLKTLKQVISRDGRRTLRVKANLYFHLCLTWPGVSCEIRPATCGFISGCFPPCEHESVCVRVHTLLLQCMMLCDGSSDFPLFIPGQRGTAARVDVLEVLRVSERSTAESN